jgi:hypothetical protein
MLWQTVGDEIALPNFMAYAQVPLKFGHELPRANITGSAPKQDRGWSCGSTSSGLKHLTSGCLIVQRNHPNTVVQAGMRVDRD